MSRNEVRTVRRGEVRATDLGKRIEAATKRVRERAYEIFANRGAHDGNDLDDWIKAEEEILMPLPCEMVSDGESLTVHLTVQGFEPDELAVNILNGRLVIEGNMNRVMQYPGDEETTEEHNSFLQQVAMPENADLDHVTADFRHHELRVKVPLMAAKKPAQSESTPAAEAKTKSTAA